MVTSCLFKACAFYAFTLVGQVLPVSGSFDGVSKDFEISTDGRNRTYRIHLPSNYDANTPAPLIISYHGHGQDMVQQETLSQFSNNAINPNMIAVYPQGLKGASGKRSWEGEFDPATGVHDKLFTSDLITHLETNYCIDSSRIYANGMSDGGGFANTLACSPDHGAAFATFAPVSGAFYTDTKYSDCTPSRSPLPILEFHGYADRTIKYDGGSGNGGTLPSIPDWLSWWARRDGCVDPAADETSTAGNGYQYITYSCKGIADIVRHYKIWDLGHKWPNTSITVSPINASPIIIDFFNANQKPQILNTRYEGVRCALRQQFGSEGIRSI